MGENADTQNPFFEDFHLISGFYIYINIDFQSKYNPKCQNGFFTTPYYTVADKDLLENVQRRAVKMITNISGSYEQRLAQLGLTTLEENRERGDMVEMFKMMTGKTKVDFREWLQRCPRFWNFLPDSVKKASTVNSFKSAYDEHRNGLKTKLTTRTVVFVYYDCFLSTVVILALIYDIFLESFCQLLKLN